MPSFRHYLGDLEHGLGRALSSSPVHLSFDNHRKKLVMGEAKRRGSKDARVDEALSKLKDQRKSITSEPKITRKLGMLSVMSALAMLGNPPRRKN